MNPISQTEAVAFSPRQNEVLDCALRLLVEGGEKALTTAGIARAANCSKESLYKWFGDRNGLLAAVITYQAMKVRAVAPTGSPLDRAAFRAQLAAFAEDLLAVLSGDISLALNRLAVGQARRDEADLGRLVLDHGRRPIEIRLSALLDLGRAAGHLAFADTRDAYRTLYALIVRDLHIRLLLGDAPDRAETDLAARATEAITQFLTLYGAGDAIRQPDPARAGS